MRASRCVGIGRRGGLKILWANNPCGFDPRHRHQQKRASHTGRPLLLVPTPFGVEPARLRMQTLKLTPSNKVLPFTVSGESWRVACSKGARVESRSSVTFLKRKERPIGAPPFFWCRCRSFLNPPYFRCGAAEILNSRHPIKSPPFAVSGVSWRVARFKGARVDPRSSVTFLKQKERPIRDAPLVWCRRRSASNPRVCGCKR